MRVLSRRVFLALALAVVVSSASAAHAQNAVSITSPAGNPTWVANNPASVDASITGPALVTKVRVTIYNTRTTSLVYLSNTSLYTQFWFYNFTCPNPGQGGGVPVPCTVKVEAIGANGVTVVGSGTAPVNIIGY